MKVEFVNLGQAGASLTQAVCRLAAWHHGQGRRLLILAGDQLQAEQVDRDLWAFDPASFLPHAQAGGPDEAAEPTLVALSPLNRNQAQVLILLAPADLDDPALMAYAHLIEFVPASQGPELTQARQRYKAWSGRPGVDLAHTTRLPG